MAFPKAEKPSRIVCVKNEGKTSPNSTDVVPGTYDVFGISFETLVCVKSIIL